MALTHDSVVYVSSSDNYYPYRDINNGFTVEVREQYHIRDLIGRISSCQDPLKRSISALRIANKYSWQLLKLLEQFKGTYVAMFWKIPADQWKTNRSKTNKNGESFYADNRITASLLRLSFIARTCALRRTSRENASPLSFGLFKLKLRSLRRYKSSKAVYSV